MKVWMLALGVLLAIIAQGLLYLDIWNWAESPTLETLVVIHRDWSSSQIAAYKTDQVAGTIGILFIIVAPLALFANLLIWFGSGPASRRRGG